ncbi:hypothetical protein [Phenylobacterium sp. 58.2.17]|uniref:hypothetical protein n=1 Tax=Phenylobacterium sp. 58.2.17 TaxID=2969306 RepID=UPI002263B9F0|nr:hypothetical protein [Phenylobacterium sp. 58.2.17]MCX7585070.1 hypothetical protein [Phenylobacterium sp. 58.2.17]
MAKYAADTTVSSERSRAEIETTLRRYKADAFGYLTERDTAVVMFRMAGRHIKFILPMPDPDDREFTHTPSRGDLRTAAAAEAAWEQACRQRWRALALVIKAKLEAVAAGITTVEDEFLAHTVLPDGSTVGEWAKPQLAIAYSSAQMPKSLLISGPATHDTGGGG